jgi:hypothetical protein
VAAKEAHGFGELRVVGGDAAAVADPAKILGGIEAEAARVSPGARPAPPARRTDGLGGVSTMAMPRARASASSRGMSAQRPNRCTGRIAFVRGPSAASTREGSTPKPSFSMSAKTGRAPAIRIASTVAK